MRAGYSCGCGRTPAPGRCRRWWRMLRLSVPFGLPSGAFTW
jgi:hypothetical protein